MSRADKRKRKQRRHATKAPARPAAKPAAVAPAPAPAAAVPAAPAAPRRLTWGNEPLRPLAPQLRTAGRVDHLRRAMLPESDRKAVAFLLPFCLVGMLLTAKFTLVMLAVLAVAIAFTQLRDGASASMLARAAVAGGAAAGGLLIGAADLASGGGGAGVTASGSAGLLFLALWASGDLCRRAASQQLQRKPRLAAGLFSFGWAAAILSIPVGLLASYAALKAFHLA